jgi:iron complex outermembrane recepter protein
MRLISKFSFSILSILWILVTTNTFAQTGEIKGTIKDASTGETIVGATILVAQGKGVISDIDGNFSIKVEPGIYDVVITYVGYEPQKMKIKVADKPIVLTPQLKTQTLNEIEVVADVAKTRETPIAFSNISAKQIEEELGTKDLPMILNSTPGVYATETGGGTGDARINVRGFDQKYVAVMVDGVPVNDMENGQVFWSNWDGLSEITELMQVQRGLGASKLPIPSVGGTTNIITKSIDQKMSAKVKQEVNDYGLYRTSFGFNSGPLKGNWGVSIAGSRKWGTGWADGTFSDAYSYFLKIQKRFKKHVISFSVNGAPQKHGQRITQLPIAVYSKSLAESLGINADSVYRNYGKGVGASAYTNSDQGERGLRYNPDWGYLNGKPYSTRQNYYHKPAFNLSHFWGITEKLTLSTVVYLSIGKGGGTILKNPASLGRNPEDGTLKIDDIYTANENSVIQPSYSTTEHPANNYLNSRVNNHLWYGMFSFLNYRISESFSALFGIDARYYKGNHYQAVYDFIGADYAIDATSDLNQAKPAYVGDPAYQERVRRIGDKTIRNYDAFVTWGGLYAQAEYKKNKWTAFMTVTGSDKSYQQVDYYRKKDLVIDGKNFNQVVAWGDEFYYNGNTYLYAKYGSNSINGTNTVQINGDTTFIGTGVNRKYILNAKKYTGNSAEARYSTTLKKWFPGYSIKGGTNYKINDNMNVFVNAGFMSMAPLINSVFDNANNLYLDAENQKATSVEAGYIFKSSKIFASLNFYYLLWQNKPATGSVPTADGFVSYNINGMDAVHKGVELELKYKILKNLDARLVTSFGDWRTISAKTVSVFDENDMLIAIVDFSAKNIHIGDAAQHQYVFDMRYEPIKHLYFTPRFTYFANNYANFDPSTLVGTNKDRESWKMPDYYLIDLYGGYEYKIWKLRLNFNLGVSNLLNRVYISDAQNGNKFDANTALVYMGMGRRISSGLRISF